MIKYDLIIVGAGSAGMTCAIAAAEKGKKILVVEKSERIGGTLHWTAGQMSAGGTRRQKARGIVDSPAQHYADVMRICENTAQPDLVQLATQLAPKTLDWLEDLGFPFAENTPTIVHGHEPYSIPRTVWGEDPLNAGVTTQRTGIHIYNCLLPLWEKYIAAGNIELFLNTKMTRLLVQNRSINGIRTKIGAFFAQKVVLTTGGYASNPAFFAKMTPKMTRLLSSAAPTSTGDGIFAAQNMGAKFKGSGYHLSTLGGIELEPQSGRADFGSAWALVSNVIVRKPREIYVNEQAKRFMDENEPSVDARERIVMKQPNQRFWVIFDEKSLSEGASLIPQWTAERIRTEAKAEKCIWKATTITGLAKKIGLDATVLKETVDQFNKSVLQQKDNDWSRTYLEHSVTTAPFYALLTYAYSLISFGGLAVNRNLQVLDNQGNVIKGLYAAGEILGAAATSGNAFCGGMLLTPALSFGRYLGETINT
jgi:flavocytochrome c